MIEVEAINRKLSLVGVIYREFRQLGVPESEGSAQQFSRWEKLLETWSQALDSGRDCPGDFNLNFTNNKPRPRWANRYHEKLLAAVTVTVPAE